MRVNHWLILLFSALLVFASGRIIRAQAPEDPDAAGRVRIGSQSVPQVYQMAQPGRTTNQVGTQPSSYPQFNSLAAQYGRSSIDPVQAPTPLLPSPDMSPFNLSYDQHYNENGLWVNKSNRSSKQYFFTVDYLRTKTRRPTGLVGNPLAASYLNTIDINSPPAAPLTRQTIATTIGGDLGLAQVVASAQGQLTQSEVVGFPPLTGFPGTNFFDRQSLSVFGNVNSNGARLRGGWNNPDGSSVVLTGWWSAQRTDTFDAADTVAEGRGSRADLNLAIIEELKLIDGDRGGLLRVRLGDSLTGFNLSADNGAEVLSQNLLNLRGLPLDDGTFRSFNDGTFSGGLTAPFDLEFRVDFTVETGGGSANWVMSPVREYGKLQLRPVMGLRYLYIREDFSFVGRDSGFSYTPALASNPDIKIHSIPNFIDDDGDGIIDNAGSDEGGGAGGGGAGGGGQAAFFDPTRVVNFPELYPITSFLNNRGNSHLAGPEVGFQYGVAGKRFNLWGQAKFALLANHERVRIDGDNIGMVTRPGSFILPDTQNPFPNTFADGEKNTHISPLVEASLMFEADIFANLPLLNRVQLVRNATFSAGYTYTWVGEVLAPEGSIQWQGNPRQGIFPLIDVERTKWTVSSLNFGLHWDF